MATISLDFKFNPLSAEYGRFLVDVHSLDSAVILADVTWHYAMNLSGNKVTSVTISEDMAMLLKLKFGANLVVRPEPLPDMRIIKNRNYYKSIPEKHIYYDFEQSFHPTKIKDDLVNSFITRELKEELDSLDLDE